MNFIQSLFLIYLVAISFVSSEFDSTDYLVKVTSQTGDQAVVEGESIVLFCDVRTASGSPPVNPGKIQYRWLFNGLNLNAEPRKHANNNQLIILKTDYTSDFGEYKCQVFLPSSSYPFESSSYSLNIHWISKTIQIVHFKYPEHDEDLDLPIQTLPIETINQFKVPFKLALKCQAFGYPELQFDWFLNAESIVAPNIRLSGSKYSIENNNLYIIGQDNSVNGVYTCSARNSVRSLNSQNNFLIKVKNKRTTSLELKSITNDLIVNEGQTIVLNCEFSNYDQIQWYSPTNNQITNSSKTLISTNNTVLIIQHASRQDEGVYRCIAFKLKSMQQYSIRVQLAFIDQFPTFSILALYNQNFKSNDLIIVPEHSKFELLCLTPNAKPEPKIYWINPQNKVISNHGIIRVLDNNQLLLQKAELDHSGEYSCVAENIASKRTKRFTIKVQKLPPIANLEIQTEQIVKEQTNITLDCLEKETNNLSTSSRIDNSKSNSSKLFDYLSIQWYHNGSLINANDKRKIVNNLNGQLTINQIHSSDEGIYICQINHTGYPLTYNSGYNLKVIELLKFIQLPVDRKLELNRSAKVHCRARTSIDSSNLQIKWVKGDSDLLLKSLQPPIDQFSQDQRLNLNTDLLKSLKQLINMNQLNSNRPISNQTNTTIDTSNIKDENGYLIIKQMTKDDEGFFTCLAFTSQELIYTTIRLDSVIMPKFIRIPPETVTRTVQDNLQLDCIATADPKPYIKWDKNNDQNLILNNNRIQTFDNGSLIIQNLTAADEGKYSCLVGNSGGFIRAESFVTIRSLADLKIELLNSSLNESSFNSRIQQTVAIALGIAFLYIMAIVGLLVWFRYKRIADRRLLHNEILQGTSSNSSNRSNSTSSSNQGTKSNSLEKCTLSDQLELKNTYQLFNPEIQKSSTHLINDYDSNSTKSNQLLDSNSIKSTDSFNRKNLQQIMLLGNGEFGNVFLGKTTISQMSNNAHETMVMVKSLQSQDPLIINEFNEEIDMFKKLTHSRIARLFAICFETDPKLMILEYSDFGDLKQYLLATRLDYQSTTSIKPEPLNKIQLLRIAIQITDAMCYLTNEYCVHKDLATRNCLISSNLDIKITSCSLSNDTYSKEYIKFRNRNLPLRWCAYEALFDNQFTKYSDVWSFAILFIELISSAELPFNELKDEQVFNLLKCKQLKLNAQLDMFSEHLILQLEQCLNYEITERPSFTSLHSTIINELNFING